MEVQFTELAAEIQRALRDCGISCFFAPDGISPGAVWENENGPNGGDEVNLILPGRNYGWPTVSYGRQYPGPRVSEHAWKEGMEEPVVVWLP